ncbi:MAG: MFS transporter [Myxococcota bacterium]
MRDRSPLAVIFAVVTLDLIGFGVIIPLLPLYAKEFGANGTLVTLLFASYSLMQFIFAPMWGRLSDRIGRRPVLLVSIAGNVIALIGFGLARSYVWLLLARLAAGAFTANISVANAYVADVTTPENRAKGMGMVGAAFGIGFVIGPFVGGELGVFGFGVPAFAAAALGALNLLAAWRFLPESLAPERRRRHSGESLRARFLAARTIDGLGLLLALAFLQVFAFSMLEVIFVLFGSVRLGFDARAAGRVFAYIGVVMVIIQGGGIGPAVRRYGERRLVLGGLALLAIGLGFLPLTPPGGWGMLLAMTTLVSVGQGLLSPSLTSLLSRRTPRDRQGAVLGLAHSLTALARVLGPPIAGVTYDLVGVGAPFWVAAAVMTLAFVAAAAWLDTSSPDAVVSVPVSGVP